MPTCEKCGAEISDVQYRDYHGLCPDCAGVKSTGLGGFRLWKRKEKKRKKK
ncbi:MAG: hypothetical protein ACFE9C_12125 [Candidatus Hodarchaeota archaeon]